MNALVRAGWCLPLWIGLVLGSGSLASAATNPAESPNSPATRIWSPRPGTSWQWQLSGTMRTSVPAEVVNIDGADASKDLVRTLQAKGKRVICYMSAGSWERWRDDADAFPSAVKGRKLAGGRGERWLDVLLPIMEKRIMNCSAKGVDGVEPDNVDGYTNRTGVPLGAAHQRSYNRAIVSLAHKHGLAVGLKNDAEQVKALERHFDFAVVEECVRYRECDSWRPFIRAREAVFHAEYRGSLARICRTTEPLGFSTIRKRLSLRVYRRTC